MRKKGSITVLALWVTLLLALVITVVLSAVFMKQDLGKNHADALHREMDGYSVAAILKTNGQLEGEIAEGSFLLDTDLDEFKGVSVRVIDNDGAAAFQYGNDPNKPDFSLEGQMEEREITGDDLAAAKEEIRSRFEPAEGNFLYEYDGNLYLATREEYEAFYNAFTAYETAMEESQEEDLDPPAPPGRPPEPGRYYETLTVLGDAALDGHLLAPPVIDGSLELKGVYIGETPPENLRVHGALFTKEGLQKDDDVSYEFLNRTLQFVPKSLRSLR